MWQGKRPLLACALLINEFKGRRLVMSSDRVEGPGSTDKPLGDAGSGASGGGSLGNQPGPGAATGGDPAQGVRQPTSGEAKQSPRQHPSKQEVHLSRATLPSHPAKTTRPKASDNERSLLAGWHRKGARSTAALLEAIHRHHQASARHVYFDFVGGIVVRRTDV